MMKHGLYWKLGSLEYMTGSSDSDTEWRMRIAIPLWDGVVAPNASFATITAANDGSGHSVCIGDISVQRKASSVQLGVKLVDT